MEATSTTRCRRRSFARGALSGIALAACAALAPQARAAEGPGKPKPPASCVTCHAELSDAALEPTRHMSDDVHFQRGLSCHDCHGGDPGAGADGDIFAAHDEGKGFRGKPARLKIPEFCARCHSDVALMKSFNPQARVDQYGEYRTSVHGLQNAKGDENVAVCIDCHGVHGIRSVKDPRSPVHPTRVADTCAHCHSNGVLMDRYKIPSGQQAHYKSSVHANALYEKGDLSAPTCNDCHGSHGAAPPGVRSVANVCGSCHTREATLFRETEAKLRVDLSPCIQCRVCHDNHAVSPPGGEMLGVGPRSTCTACHAADTAGYKGAAEMAAARARLQQRVATAHELLGRVERAGVEVSADRLALQQAHDQLVELRVLAHSFDRDRFVEAADVGLAAANKGIAAAERAFRELGQRRLGLAVSLVFIVGLIVALALKLKELERPAPDEPPAQA